MNVFREFTSFRKENTDITEVYEPYPIEFGYIPEGYSVSERAVGDRTRLFDFFSDDSDKNSFIVFYEFGRPVNHNNANSEGGGIEVISINGHNCFVVTSSEIDEVTSTIYLTDSVIKYVGNLDYKEMTQFLEAINILKQK